MPPYEKLFPFVAAAVLALVFYRGGRARRKAWADFSQAVLRDGAVSGLRLSYDDTDRNTSEWTLTGRAGDFDFIFHAIERHLGRRKKSWFTLTVRREGENPRLPNGWGGDTIGARDHQPELSKLFGRLLPHDECPRPILEYAEK